MRPEELVQAIEAVGGRLTVMNERIFYTVPQNAVGLLDALRSNREAVLDHLRDKSSIPLMPQGVRLVNWAPREPPLVLVKCSVVNDVVGFIRRSLQELGVALSGDHVAAAHSVRELADVLEQAGVRVEIAQNIRRSP